MKSAVVFASLPHDEEAAAERLGVAPIDYAPESPAIAAIERLMCCGTLSATRLDPMEVTEQGR